MKPRSMYPPFVHAGDQYLNTLLPIVSPLQVMYKSFDLLKDSLIILLYTLLKFAADRRWEDNFVV